MLKASVRHFMAVVEHGSFRAAAEALHIAQSAVSRRIQALEHELGADLFERRAKGVALTPAGEVLSRSLRDLEFQFDRMRSEIDALQGLRRGVVRVATIESLVTQVIPSAIAAFRALHPGITFEVQAAGSDVVVQKVRAGEAEIGIAFNQPAAEGINVAYRIREPVFAVMSPKHPLARARTLTLSDLAGYPLGHTMPWSGTRQLVDAAARKSGLALPPVLITNSIELLHRFALRDMGIAFLSRLACLDSIAAGRVVVRQLAEKSLSAGAIEVLTLASRRLPVAAEEFQRVLAAELRRLPALS